MEQCVSSFVSGFITQKVDSNLPFLSGLPVYVRDGLCSGWTSGFLSGYQTTMATIPISSGIIGVQLNSMASNEELSRFLVISCQRGMDNPITTWEFPSESLVKDSVMGIRQWLFRR